MESMRDEEDPAIECHEDCRTILVKYGDAGLKGITFNKVCSPRAQQEDVFEECRVTEMIMQALDGYSATIFAFGQTGSGKTFTITGPDTSTTRECDPSRFGIIPRALQHLYQVLDQKQQESPNIECKVSAAYLEIYNEQVQDLLNPNGASLPIRWNAARGFYVENLLIVECETYEDWLGRVGGRTKKSKDGVTQLERAFESKSQHYDIYVTTKEIDPDDGKPMVKHGRISFVDLAGSERVKSSKASGDTLNETLNINKSLLTLGNCISCLADTRRREGHIPYRDSKLTMLLSDSLGGHGIALMIACISPSTLNFHETIKTLRYAQRAKKIRNKPIVLVDPVLDVVVQLKREVKGLRRENAALRARVESRQQGDGLRLPAIAGITPQTSMQQMYMQPSYANTPQPQQQQQQLQMQQRYTPQIYTPRPPSQPPPSHLQHLQHNPQTLTPHPPSQPPPSHIPAHPPHNPQHISQDSVAPYPSHPPPVPQPPEPHAQHVPPRNPPKPTPPTAPNHFVETLSQNKIPENQNTTSPRVKQTVNASR
ncbi:P-loop containing nucleoside triphosphate hydrolase protein [Chytridium lagenaria]|nr:P-loop containing nucleoside triphosphate hydrolase protein [Chytridium lagenaria]